MSTSPLSPEAVEVQAPPDLEFPELARPVKAEGLQYAGLTPVERALAEDDLHMSTCDEPSIDGCGDCQRKLARFRRLIEVASPVIEAGARADERRKLYPAVVARLLNAAAWYAPVGLADPAEISATDLAVAEAFRSEAKAWEKAGAEGGAVGEQEGEKQQ